MKSAFARCQPARYSSRCFSAAASFSSRILGSPGSSSWFDARVVFDIIFVSHSFINYKFLNNLDHLFVIHPLRADREDRYRRIAYVIISAITERFSLRVTGLFLADEDRSALRVQFFRRARQRVRPLASKSRITEFASLRGLPNPRCFTSCSSPALYTISCARSATTPEKPKLRESRCQEIRPRTLLKKIAQGVLARFRNVVFAAKRQARFSCDITHIPHPSAPSRRMVRLLQISLVLKRVQFQAGSSPA